MIVIIMKSSITHVERSDKASCGVLWCSLVVSVPGVRVSNLINCLQGCHSVVILHFC